MLKFTVILLNLLMLEACTPYFANNDTAGDNSGFFAEASDCYQSSLRKERIKVPTGNSMTVVDVPSVYDAGAFSNCMTYSGHTAPKADAEAFLALSQRCLQEARNATNPDDAYAACIRHGDIAVETFIERKIK